MCLKPRGGEKKNFERRVKGTPSTVREKKKLTMWACLCRMKEETYGEEATLITLHHLHAVSFLRNTHTHTHLHSPNLSEFYAFHFPPLSFCFSLSLSSWFEYLTWFLYYYYCILLHTYGSTLLLVAVPPKAFTTTFPLPINTQFLPLTSSHSITSFSHRNPILKPQKAETLVANVQYMTKDLVA